jgi:hypothetical protein
MTPFTYHPQQDGFISQDELLLLTKIGVYAQHNNSPIATSDVKRRNMTNFSSKQRSEQN